MKRGMQKELLSVNLLDTWGHVSDGSQIVTQYCRLILIQ